MFAHICVTCCVHILNVLFKSFSCFQIFQMCGFVCVRVASDMCVVVVGLSNSLCILQLASHDLSCSILLPHMRQVVGEDKPQER